jgi:putative FmdB family regulatory protein
MFSKLVGYNPALELLASGPHLDVKFVAILEDVVMPIYEYECKACGHRHEAIQKMSDAALVDCPACNKPELKKLISATGFRLKGGGWYETDFKGSNQKNVSKPEASSSDKKPATGCGAGGCGCA